MNEKNAELAKQIEIISHLLETNEKNLQKVRSILQTLESESKKDMYREVPGVTGTFNGISMTAEDGKNYDVPANYAAKSRLVFGDVLKLIDEGDKKVFKQIEKVERRKIEGILTKKEGRWYILSDAGSYKISDNAAEFNNAQLNDEAVALIPANNVGASFAALDSLKKKPQPMDQQQLSSFQNAANATKEKAVQTSKPQFDHKPQVAPKPTSDVPAKSSTKKYSPTSSSKPSITTKPKDAGNKNYSVSSKPAASPTKPAEDRPAKPAVKPAPKPKREFVENIISLKEDKSGEIPTQGGASKALDDDDLR